MAHAAKWITAEPKEPVTSVALQSLKSRLQPVQKLLPLAAQDHEGHIEYVHQLRVWTRRADAALKIYADLLPEWRVAWIEEQLARIRKATNDARDDDVFATRLVGDKSPAAAKLLKRIRQHRIESQKRVCDVFQRLTRKSGRFDRRVEKLLRRVRLRGKRRRKAEPTYREWAADRLPAILEKFFELAEGNLKDTESLHQCRIAGKELRYALELLSAAFGPNLRKTAYPLLEALQEQLGRVNDHASATARIARWIAENERPEQNRFLAEMLENQQNQLRTSRRRFSVWWSNQRRNRLRKAFDEIVGDGTTARKRLDPRV